MTTLNQIASRITSIIGKQADHSANERAKDAFKNILATRLRQSVERNGIDTTIKIAYPMAFDHAVASGITDIVKLTSKSKIPVPIRIRNDAPFTYVGTSTGESFSFRSMIEIQQYNYRKIVGNDKFYVYDNTSKSITLYIKSTYNSGTAITTTGYESLLIESVYANPEEVMSMYATGVDDQTIDLPFPEDTIESIILELLKTEYNLIPPETEVKA